MSAAVEWDAAGFRTAFLTELEQAALTAAGYGGRSGLGARPVLLVVDVTGAFCGPPGAGLLEAIASHPLASGPAAWEAVPRIAELVEAARRSDTPVVFTRPRPPHRSAVESTRWNDKNARQQDSPPDAHEICVETGYRVGDRLIEKEAPSAFSGSSLPRWLVGLGCDSVIVCGGTSSGCVRATAVDAFSLDLKVTVAADACFDRVLVSHQVTLFDIDLKYGDVRSVGDIADELMSRPASATGLPSATG